MEEFCGMKEFLALQSNMSAPSYFDKIDQWVAAGSTSGENLSEALIQFTVLNQKRIKRILKTYKVSESLQKLLDQLQGEQHWFVFTEAWCGDSAQLSPIFAKIAEASKGKIHLSFLLRDEHPTLMDRYLTNGGRSIPKLVAFDESGLELFQYGPRPAAAQALLIDWKQNPRGRSHEYFEQELHASYAKDRGKSTETELLELLQQYTHQAC